ncbi:MAG: AAA-like domain-containing protein [Cyanobacteria bacterium J06554_6]
MNWVYPDGALPLDSSLYVERPPVEALAYQEIQKAGSLVRIKAPRGMGKSSLVLRVLNHAQSAGCQTVWVDFRTADLAAYTDLTLMLQWFCGAIARQLNLEPRFDELWNDMAGTKLACTSYLENYLLPAAGMPLALALSEVDRLFEYPDLSRDFLPLVRFWHESSKYAPDLRGLRLIVAHKTEIYIPLNINQSPFNVGLPIQLQPFTLTQVHRLAQHHGLEIDEALLQPLLDLLGGHPNLTAVAFYHLQQVPAAQVPTALAQLVEAAPTQAGIYSHYLRGCYELLRQRPRLLAGLKQVIAAAEPIQLAPACAHQLASLGLVKVVGNQCELACALYRQYFAQHELFQQADTAVEKLTEENQQLKTLVNLDSLTRIANRRYFDHHLSIEWQRMASSQLPLSLLLLDIDCFKQYNDTYGHTAGDRCLQQVAKAIRNSLNRPADLAARYGGEEFVVILPMTDLAGAQQLAENIRSNIAALKIDHPASAVPTQIITLSIGIATVWPQPNASLEAAMNLADQMLYQAKRNGRNRVCSHRETQYVNGAQASVQI